MRDKFSTQKFDANLKSVNTEIYNTMSTVYKSLKEKGYNPTNQIVGYILSGDPTYITGHNNARSLISKFECDELLEDIVNFYLEHHENIGS